MERLRVCTAQTLVTQTDTHTDRQTDRQTQTLTQTDRRTDGQTLAQTDTHKDGRTDRFGGPDLLDVTLRPTPFALRPSFSWNMSRWEQLTFLDVGPELVLAGTLLEGLWELHRAGAEVPEQDPERVHVHRVIVLPCGQTFSG